MVIPFVGRLVCRRGQQVRKVRSKASGARLSRIPVHLQVWVEISVHPNQEGTP
jgi:hypothetical protein